MPRRLSLRSKFYLLVAPLAVASLLMSVSAARTATALGGSTDQLEDDARQALRLDRVLRLVQFEAVVLADAAATRNASAPQALSALDTSVRALLDDWAAARDPEDRVGGSLVEDYDAFMTTARAYLDGLAQRPDEEAPASPRARAVVYDLEEAAAAHHAAVASRLDDMGSSLDALLLPVLRDRFERLGVETGIAVSASEAASGLVEQLDGCYRYVRSNGADGTSYIDEGVDETEEAAERWQALAASAEPELAIASGTPQDALAAQAALYGMEMQVVDAVQDGRGAEALAFLSASVVPQLSGTYVPQIETAVDVHTSRLGVEAARLVDAIQTTGLLWAIGGGLLTGAAVLGPWYFSRSVVRPIMALEGAAAAVASGRRDVRVAVGAGGEVGRLALSFNAMLADVQRAEQGLQQAYTRLAEADRNKTLFINAAAHELNTPLTPVKLQVFLLRGGRHGPLTPAQERAVTTLDRNVDRLRSLVGDLLTAARVNEGGLEIQRRECDLVAVLNEAIDTFSTSADVAGVSLGLAGPARLPVDADPGRVTQVALNLISNALKYTPQGGTVSVAVDVQDDAAVVHVRDSGVGMDADQVARLFQPFAKVHDGTEAARPGNGLGLYICRGIVEGHGGRIWCRSPGAGSGATFSFTLPLLACGPPAAATAWQGPDGAGAT